MAQEPPAHPWRVQAPMFDASEEQKKEFAAWLEIVRDAADPDAYADGVAHAAVHMGVEQMEVDEEGEEQGEG